MADTKLTPSMLRAQDRAVEMTALQIEAALQLNAKYFDGEGLEHVGAILQALATNYNASTLYAKSNK